MRNDNENKSFHVSYDDWKKDLILYLIEELPYEKLEEIKEILFSKIEDSVEKENMYHHFLELLSEKKTREQKKKSNIELVIKMPQKMDDRYDVLMEHYINLYIDQKKKGGHKIKRSDIEANVSNHSKFYRMLRDHGRGKQYRDDMRRVCFILELSFSESMELLYTSGQIFDRGDRRDQILMECLINQIYDEDKINKLLEIKKCESLFIVDEEKSNEIKQKRSGICH